MTFKSYLEHTEAIFKELHIFDIFKINNYLTALLMFRTTKFINIIRETVENLPPNRFPRQVTKSIKPQKGLTKFKLIIIKQTNNNNK